LLIIAKLVTAVQVISGALVFLGGILGSLTTAVIPALAKALMFLTMNPIGLTIMAVAGLIAIGIALWQNWETVKEKFVEIIEGLPGPVKFAANLIITYWNAVLIGIEKVVNGIAGAINSIPGFTVPKFVPGIGGQSFSPPRMSGVSLPRIPMLAEGGIVNRPTLAMIGEAGPEAVIPLSGPNSKPMGNTFNITVNAGIGTDGMQVGRQIVDAIKRFEKQSGPVFAGV